MSGKRKYYWDTDVFLAWLKGEKGKVELVDGIVSEVRSGKAIIVTSVMTTTEIFEGNLTEERKKQFKLLMGRRDVTQVHVDHNISDLARELREYFQRKKKKKLSTPDATHLATAAIYKVDEFHTFDEGLLARDGDIPGYPLKICKPESIQKSFGFPSN